MQHDAASDQGLHCSPFIMQILDAAIVSKVNFIFIQILGQVWQGEKLLAHLN